VTRGITNLGESGVGPPHHSMHRTDGGDRLIAVGTRAVRWVGVAIDCADAGPVARFYEQLLGFRIGDFDPPRWAQLSDPDGGVHLNIQGDTRYRPPHWPEQDGQPGKMLHFEVQVDDVATAVAVAVDAGGREAAWQPPDRDPTRIRIVLDPAGHPLCLFVRGE